MKKILKLHFQCKNRKLYWDQERIFNSSVKLILRYGWETWKEAAWHILVLLFSLQSASVIENLCTLPTQLVK